MMWETSLDGNLAERRFNFKCVLGRNIKGLNTPAAFTRQQLAEIFDMYRHRSGNQHFPWN